ncbi:MAG: tetratricopeptide repeat protein [Promethearchaeota archaeon]
MVATMNNNDYFKKSKELFESGDISNSLENYEKALAYIDIKDKSGYIQFLTKLLNYCKENNLIEEEAIVLRSMGRTFSIFKQYVESLRFHEESLKIQRKLGNKLDVAEGLIFLAEDLEISGNYDKCIKAYQDAAELFHELGKLRVSKEIKKEIKRLKEFSEEMVEDEYMLHKFHVDKY